MSLSFQQYPWVLHDQKEWDRGGGLVHPEDKISMTMSGLIAKISQ